MDLLTVAAAKLLQLCPTLWDPRDGSPLGFSVSGILQARILEWVAISFSNAWKRKVKVKSLSHVRLLATPWTAAYQAPPSMGFSRQEYCSGVPLPSPGSGHYVPSNAYSFIYIFYKLILFLAAPCRILLPWPRVEIPPPVLETQSLNHWTAREVPTVFKNVKINEDTRMHIQDYLQHVSLIWASALIFKEYLNIIKLQNIDLLGKKPRPQPVLLT